MIPTKKQFLNWSTPSKASYIGCVAGLIGIPLAILLWLFSGTNTESVTVSTDSGTVAQGESVEVNNYFGSQGSGERVPSLKQLLLPVLRVEWADGLDSFVQFKRPIGTLPSGQGVAGRYILGGQCLMHVTRWPLPDPIDNANAFYSLSIEQQEGDSLRTLASLLVHEKYADAEHLANKSSETLSFDIETGLAVFDLGERRFTAKISVTETP